MMKNYKDFEKVYIGASDIADLIVRSVCDIGNIHFGRDGGYSAYECFGEVEIGEHYQKVFEGKWWLRIYDDEKATYYKDGREFETEYKKVDIYRAGDKGCIIHWHN